uniref:Uncharacterized protein n=1 Tax=Rhipicephalus zambeziensis TaxID=60191 RepID=A0A224Y6W8_9ACAR
MKAFMLTNSIVRNLCSCMCIVITSCFFFPFQTAAALASTDVSNIFSSVCTIGANHSFRHHTSIVPDTGVLHRNAADEISRSFEDTGILDRATNSRCATSNTKQTNKTSLTSPHETV